MGEAEIDPGVVVGGGGNVSLGRKSRGALGRAVQGDGQVPEKGLSILAALGGHKALGGGGVSLAGDGGDSDLAGVLLQGMGRQGHPAQHQGQAEEKGCDGLFHGKGSFPLVSWVNARETRSAW